MEFLIPQHLHKSTSVPTTLVKSNLPIKYMSIRVRAKYFVKYLRKQVEHVEKKFLIVAYHKNDTLRISILEPKVPMPTIFANWRDNQYEVDFKQFGKLDRSYLFRK